MRKPLVLTIVFVFACGITLSSIMASAQEDYNIPAWIKNNAAWWSEGQIDDASFVSGIKYMIENGIMEISQGDNQVANDELYKENQRLNSLLDEYQAVNDGFAENEEILHAEIDSLKAQLQAAQQSTSTTGSSPVQKIQDNGDFYLVYVESDNYSDYEEWVKDGMSVSPGFFDRTVDWMNELLRLPYDVPIFFYECGMTNAYFDPAAKEIVICYELVEDYLEKNYWVYQESSGSEAVNLWTLNVVDYVLFHEVGHALVDIYDLPVTGLEEDVVDQFSAYINAEFSPGTEGQDEIRSAAFIYEISHTEDELQVSYFADTHSLSLQRFYNLACWVYGYDPIYNEDLVGSDILPIERAQNCAYEYHQIVTAWDNLLEPFFK